MNSHTIRGLGLAALGLLGGAGLGAASCASSAKATSGKHVASDAGAGGAGGEVAFDAGEDPAPDAGPPVAADCGIELSHFDDQVSGCGTLVTGRVFAPNGTLPLYDAIVYVPKTTPDPIVHGATCDPCGHASGSPVAATLSRYDGSFALRDVPAGKDVPLVVQVGKWRRQVTIPEVVACAETKLDPELTRLPRSQSEGDLPRIALTTGPCDQLGCLLPKVGVAASEVGWGDAGPSKSVHVYRSYDAIAPLDAGVPPVKAFWSDPAKLRAYDLVLLSCECSEARDGDGATPPGRATKGKAAFAAMADYLRAGGRIFTTDYQYTWYRYSPDQGLASAAQIVGGAPAGPSPMHVDTCFPKGAALGAWLETVAPGTHGAVGAAQMFANVTSLDADAAQGFAWSGAGANQPRVFSVNVPVGVPAADQCGRGVHVDAHVSEVASGSGQVDETYPAACGATLLDTEKLLAFFLFDLAACIQDERQPPTPPK